MARWLVSFAADALKRLVICNRIIQSDVQKRSIDPSPPSGQSNLPRRQTRYRSFLEREDREALSDRLAEAAASAPDYICPRKIGFLSLGPRRSTPRPVSLRALFIRAHKDVQDFPRILPEIPGESASTERSSEYRDRGGGEKRERWRRKNYCWVIRVAGPTSRVRYIFRLLLPYWSFHRFEEYLSCDGYFASTLVESH